MNLNPGGNGPTTITNVADGKNPSDAVNVNQLNTATNKWVTGNPETYKAPTAIGVNATAIGSGSIAIGNNSIAIGNNSFDDGRANVLSVGSQGNERQITNVAAGTQGTDAVNVNQLNQGMSVLNANMTQQVNRLDARIDQQERMLSGGIAAAAALAVVTPVEPGRYHVTGGMAAYNGQVGIGFNVLKRSDNGQRTLHAGVGYGTGGSKAIVRVGFGFSFD
ncbi:MAG: hypothetical protein EOO29_04610 [Comamonadaceae bacterium]|nr:MAG: hypothetical protein EOO29_04610 [Comamonadaceae bacterium]